MNIEAIEKAAEAALKSERRPVHVYREELEYDGAIDWRVQNQYGDEYASCGEYKSVAELIAALDPATVLELVRLARIGLERQWISVKERLPKIGETVLIFIASDYQITVMAILKSDRPTWRSWEGDNIFNDAIVTHWMPLPEPPHDE